MKKWILKAIVQKTISYLPYPNQINYVFQKYVTKGVYLNDIYFYDRLQHASDHLKAYREATNKATPEVCLELGTGWYPVVPISYFLSGVDQIYSVDISMLTSKERIRTTILKFFEANEKGLLPQYLTVEPSRFEVLRALLTDLDNLTFDQILARLRLTYLIEDARHLSLPDNSIDLVNSNNTFEHIYPAILAPIMQEFKRVVRKNTGVMSHFIDMSDHFAHFDQSITIYNFLQFSKKQWEWIDNDIQPMSRLRLPDYHDLYRTIGIQDFTQKVRPGNLTDLEKVEVHEDFKKYSPEDIAVSHVQLVSVH